MTLKQLEVKLLIELESWIVFPFIELFSSTFVFIVLLIKLKVTLILFLLITSYILLLNIINTLISLFFYNLIKIIRISLIQFLNLWVVLKRTKAFFIVIR